MIFSFDVQSYEFISHRSDCIENNFVLWHAIRGMPHQINANGWDEQKNSEQESARNELGDGRLLFPFDFICILLQIIHKIEFISTSNEIARLIATKQIEEC